MYLLHYKNATSKLASVFDDIWSKKWDRTPGDGITPNTQASVEGEEDGELDQKPAAPVSPTTKAKSSKKAKASKATKTPPKKKSKPPKRRTGYASQNSRATATATAASIPKHDLMLVDDDYSSNADDETHSGLDGKPAAAASPSTKAKQLNRKARAIVAKTLPNAKTSKYPNKRQRRSRFHDFEKGMYLGFDISKAKLNGNVKAEAAKILANTKTIKAPKRQTRALPNSKRNSSISSRSSIIIPGDGKASSSSSSSSSSTISPGDGEANYAAQDKYSHIVPSQEEIAETQTHRARGALENWYRRLREVYQFREEHGHTRVPQQYHNRELGVWVNKQRMEKKFIDEGNIKTSLNPTKIRKLEEAGFLWGKPKGVDCWERNFEALKAFIEEHGHPQVPTKYKENKTLGRWVSVQRDMHNKFHSGEKTMVKGLAEEEMERRLSLLDSVGFFEQPVKLFQSLLQKTAIAKEKREREKGKGKEALTKTEEILAKAAKETLAKKAKETPPKTQETATIAQRVGLFDAPLRFFGVRPSDPPAPVKKTSITITTKKIPTTTKTTKESPKKKTKKNMKKTLQERPPPPNLQESMKRSLETRQALNIKPTELPEYNNTDKLSEVLNDVESSSRTIKENKKKVTSPKDADADAAASLVLIAGGQDPTGPQAKQSPSTTTTTAGSKLGFIRMKYRRRGAGKKQSETDS